MATGRQPPLDSRTRIRCEAGVPKQIGTNEILVSEPVHYGADAHDGDLSEGIEYLLVLRPSARSLSLIADGLRLWTYRDALELEEVLAIVDPAGVSTPRRTEQPPQETRSPRPRDRARSLRFILRDEPGRPSVAS
jgi:hypothetical protein